MGLAEELAELAAPSPRPRLVARILATFDGEDREALEAALRNVHGFSGRRLAAFLTSKGHPISESAISQWRRDRGYC